VSRWTPCKRPDFIRRLLKLGFAGPFSGTRHQFVTIGDHRLAIPSNPEFSVGQLRFMLREVENLLGRRIDVDQWTGLS
jgi:hypothetical protein